LSDTWHERAEPTQRRGKRRLYRRFFRCAEKRCFADEIAARVGGMLSIEERRNVPQLWVYRCVHCKRWHLTSQERGPRWAVMPAEQRKAA
jgi:hypothetical protein